MVAKQERVCSTCEDVTEFVVVSWYAETATCMACGERFEAGERMKRPFRPAWRKQSKADAKARYRMWNP